MRRTLTTLLSALALLATGVVAGFAVGGTGTVDPPPKIAFLANGINPADAVAAGSIAGQLGAPVFTTRSDILEDAAKNGIVAYAPDLVIALGGPVAISDSVLNALAAATGLTVVPATGSPTAGIVRAAGETRFDTAAAVARLVAAYRPAYLPVDATALGALDADTLDGLDSTDFALSDQACTAGQIVTGIAADGTPACAPDAIDGGDADTLDGLDSTEFGLAVVPAGETLLGTWYLDIDKVDDAGDWGVHMPFSQRLEFPPSQYVFVPVNSAGAVAGCPGDPTAPTADPGIFCMYAQSLFGLTPGFGFSFGLQDLAGDVRTLGASYIFENTGAAGDAFGHGVWAVNVAPPPIRATTADEAPQSKS